LKASNLGKAEIASYESVILTPYLDSGGVKTWMIGATISDIPNIKKIPWTQQATIQDCVSSFNTHISEYEDAVNDGLVVSVSQPQFDALVSFLYNVGVGARHSAVFRAVNSGASSAEITHAFGLWVNDNGKRVQGLVNRRMYEAELFNTGTYIAKGLVNLVPVDPTTHKPIYRKGRIINILHYFEGDKPVVPGTVMLQIPETGEQWLQRFTDIAGQCRNTITDTIQDAVIAAQEWLTKKD
jgi:lysozyme